MIKTEKRKKRKKSKQKRNKMACHHGVKRKKQKTPKAKRGNQHALRPKTPRPRNQEREKSKKRRKRIKPNHLGILWRNTGQQPFGCDKHTRHQYNVVCNRLHTHCVKPSAKELGCLGSRQKVPRKCSRYQYRRQHDWANLPSERTLGHGG